MGTPSLSKCTESGYSGDYSDDKIHATDSYSLNGIQTIQADMVQYGSATAAFTVYSDFPTYKSGVYKHTSGSQLGGHAVKLLGWGTENGEDYWLVANSWNEQWGDNGTFKIARGINECGIEGQVSAGRAGSTNVETSGGTLAVTWEDCGDASTHGHITDLQPTTLQVGSAGTLTGTGTLDEELTGGDFTIKFTALLGITETYTGKVCEAKTFQLPLGVGSVSWLGLGCPLAPGTVTAKIGFETKSTIPAALAKVEFDVSATDQSGAKALCVKANLAQQSDEFSV